MSNGQMISTGGGQDLTGFQWDTLFILAEMDRPCGLEIKDAIETYYGNTTEITHGRLYTNLDKLETKGLIVKGQRDRRTNEYRMTNRGLRELQVRHQWQSQKLENSQREQTHG